MSWFAGLLRGLLLAVPIMAMAQQDGIRVENAWSRVAMQGGTGVVYLTITDSGAPDRLDVDRRAGGGEGRTA